MFRHLEMIALLLATTMGADRAAEPLKVGVFAVDASPPIGSPLAYDPTKGVAHPLSCRGVVLVGEGRPVVLCAVDWIGIANDGQVEFRQRWPTPPEPTRNGSRFTRFISMTPRSAISRPIACSPSRGSTARFRRRLRPRRDRASGRARSASRQKKPGRSLI